MSTKNLKLVGIKTYSSPGIANIILNQGDIVKVPETTAERMLGLRRFSDNDEIEVPYFQETSEDPTYDVTLEGVKKFVGQVGADGVQAAKAATPVIEATTETPGHEGLDTDPAPGSSAQGNETNTAAPAAKATRQRAPTRKA